MRPLRGQKPRRLKAETEDASKIKTEKIIIKRMDEVISWDALCFYMRKITIIESDQWEGFLKKLTNRKDS